jgi:hypothetical protein
MVHFGETQGETVVREALVGMQQSFHRILGLTCVQVQTNMNCGRRFSGGLGFGADS